MRYNWIEIKDVAAKYNVTEERLTKWAEQGKLISIKKKRLYGSGKIISRIC